PAPVPAGPRRPVVPRPSPESADLLRGGPGCVGRGLPRRHARDRRDTRREGHPGDRRLLGPRREPRLAVVAADAPVRARTPRRLGLAPLLSGTAVRPA